MRRRWIAAVALVVSVPVTATATGWRLVEVTSDSMTPTLSTGDRVITAPMRDAPERGDVVVFTPPDTWRDAYTRWQQGRSAPERMVKRVVALGGDTVECCAADARLLINGVRVEEPYLAVEPGRGNAPTYRITVPEGYLWLLGDNRDDSFDSSVVRGLSGAGAVAEDAVTGKVLGTD